MKTPSKVISILEDNTNATYHVQDSIELGNSFWSGYYDDHDCAVYISEKEHNTQIEFLDTLFHELAHYFYDYKHSGIRLPKIRLIEEEAFADSFKHTMLKGSIEAGLKYGKGEFDTQSRIAYVSSLRLKHAKVNWDMITLALLQISSEIRYLRYVRRILSHELQTAK